jgi:undecaprenyl-phosphate galactose phosphotransferase
MIGINRRTAEICTALKESLSLGFDVRWLVIEDPGIPAPQSMSAIRPIHSSDPARIAQIIGSSGCKEAIVAAEDMQSAHFAEVVQRLLEVNIPVAIIPSINRLPLAGVTTNYFFGRDILMLQVRSNVQRLPSRIVKRIFDIIISTFLIVMLSPLFAIIAIAIKRADPGKITYAHRRVGRDGVPFDCLKFRTMVTDADARLQRWQDENPDLYEEYRRTFKLRDDPRITGIGKWLRRTSLDELPQLWNVLMGHMSLVGPRPVVQRELEEYYGPAAQLYVRTRPGMTGLWQVSGRSDTSYERRVFLDEWYILNWSFWYDIVILIQTAWIVATGKGAF